MLGSVFSKLVLTELLPLKVQFIVLEVTGHKGSVAHVADFLHCSLVPPFSIMSCIEN